jgi:Carboxypeptidase regulatory-like domain
MLRARVRPMVGLAGAALVLATSLAAQLNRGVIEGILTDPQGAMVPAVDVTITNIETNVSVTLKTNSAGYYRAVDLVPGRYRADFSTSGFAVTRITDITLPAGEVMRIDAQLKLSGTQASVQVMSEAALLETDASNFSARVDTRTIDELPMQGRDLQQLAFLVPGVTSVGGPPGANFGFNSQFGTFPDPTHVLGSDLSVHGGQGGANAWYLDGSLNLSNLSENIVVDPSPDSVSEFQAITNAFAAEYGRTGGGVFNVVLKSGTNTPHGDLYEFVRNNATSARNPFTSTDALGNAVPQKAVRFNDFGGTIGGPVVLPKIYNGKNKTFFFVSTDSQILHVLNNNAVFTVPTPLERQGNFSEDPNVVANGLWNPYSTTGPNSSGVFTRTAFGSPVSGNPYGAAGCTNTAVEAGTAGGFKTCNFSTLIPKGLLDPTAMFYMNSFPLPNYDDPLVTCPMSTGGPYKICSNFRGAVGSSWDPQSISIKIDHDISANNRLFGEWLYNPGYYNNYRVPWTGATFPNNSVGFGSNYPLNSRNQIIALGNTYIFSPSLVNEFHIAFSRQFIGTNLNQPYPDSVTDQTQVEQVLAPYHIPSQPYNPIPNFTISSPGGGSMTFGPTPFVNMNQAAEAYTAVDNLTKILGKHTLKTGFMYRLEHQAWLFGGPMLFNMAGELTEDPTTGLGGTGLAQFMLGAASSNGNTVEQVNWSPYLSMNYWGVYLQDDYRITPNFTLNIGLRYDLFGFFKIRQQPNSNFCLSCVNPETGLPGEVTYTTNGSDIYPSNKNDLAPRVNFAWTPFKDKKTVVRGGYDIFYSNAFQGANSPQSGANSPGFNIDYSWNDSYYPNQCASFTGQCVAFPLSSSTIKTQLPVPQVPASPAQLPGFSESQMLGGGGFAIFLKPEHDPMVQQWTLDVQRELPANIMLSVGYIGNHGTHLLGELFRNENFIPTADVIQYEGSINAVVPITDYYSGKTAQLLQQVYGSADLPRSILLKPYPFYNLGLTANTAWDATSHYDGMDVQVRKRFSHGLTFVMAYTWSKLMDNGLTAQLGANLVNPIAVARPGYIGGEAGAGSFSNETGGLYQNPDQKVDKTIGAFDIPQSFNVSWTYALPFGKGQTFLNQPGILNHLIGGWQLTANFNLRAGIPMSIICPADQVTTRCDLVGNPSNVPGGQNASHWFNAAAFEPAFGSDQSFWANYNPNSPLAYQFGTAGERLPDARSPGFWDMDTSLSKEFHFSEQRYFQFRWEVFNTLNHMNLGLPNTNWCLPPLANGSTNLVNQSGCSFGLITNIATDPRSMEFALKFYW